MATKKRFFYLDYLRDIALLCIIGIHTTDIIFLSNPSSFDVRWWFGAFVENIVRVGLPMYFVISGYLLLNGKDEKISEFYRRRLVRVVIPLILYSFLYIYVFSANLDIHHIRLIHSIKLILAGPVFSHLWFVYAITGLYLATPYLKVMLRALSNHMLASLIILMFVFRVMMDYIPLLKGSIGITSFTFDGWIIYYTLGYVLAKIKSPTLVRSIYIAGIIGFVGAIVQLRVFPLGMISDLFSFSPTMICMVSAAFVFFDQNKNMFPGKGLLWNIASFISKYSYSVYLAHVFVLDYYFHYSLILTNSPYQNYVIGLFATIFMVFIVSLFIAFIGDILIINPIIWLFNISYDYIKDVVVSLYRNHLQRFVITNFIASS